MATETKVDRDPYTQENDPFYLGWRYLPKLEADGSTSYEQVPLKPEDLLYPHEDDFVVENEKHHQDCEYVSQSLKTVLEGRPGVHVFANHIIDFQIPDLQPLGPDVTVIADMAEEWNTTRGTFPVKDYSARPVLAVEVTSPSNRNNDLSEKVALYERAGVPVYVLADRQTLRGEYFMTVMGYRLENGRYVRVEPDANGILWVPEVEAGFKPDGDRIRLVDGNGRFVPDHEETKQERDDQRERAEQEKMRADEAERKVTELQAELLRIRGGS